MNSSMLGLLGGTFDPIHLGHIHVALSVYQALRLSAVRLIPNAQSLLREQPVASAAQRLAMVRAAIEHHPGLEVDDREIISGGYSYTINTLQSIRTEVGDSIPLCFIMSVDQFAQFDRWQHWQAIPELAHLIITTRSGYEFSSDSSMAGLLQQRLVQDPTLLQQKPYGYVFFQSIIPLSISSTDIRNKCRLGDTSVQAFLPEKVWQYVRANNLYQSLPS